MIHLRSWCAAYATSVASATAVAQPCNPYWTKPGQFDGWSYYSPFVYDDGSGPALYARASNGYVESNPNYMIQVRRWRGQGWEPLVAGIGQLGNIWYLLPLSDASGSWLYANVGLHPSLLFRWASNPQRTRDFEWDGTRWKPARAGLYYFNESNPQNSARPLVSFDDGNGAVIYGTTGVFSQTRVGRWDGQSWTAIGHLEQCLSYHMETLDWGLGPRLVVAGQFSGIDGRSLRGIAMWDGQSWQAFGDGILSGTVFDMEVFDSGQGKELYVAGYLAEAGSVQVRGLARWNGKAWSRVPGQNDEDMRYLAVFDDGSGPALYVSGLFFSIGSVPAVYLGKFDGTSWHAVEPGPKRMGPMAVFDDGRGPSLFLSGPGDVCCGGNPGPGLIQLVGCPNCYADCDNNHRLDVNDFVCFMTKYAQQDPYANCDVGAVVDPTDFACFMAKYAAGCP
ncbi:MAG: hypothetical protein JNM80_02605 [Phycisphaerae bacterium]|nr:hypothetical protein [Phycisphaerae bacterium]